MNDKHITILYTIQIKEYEKYENYRLLSSHNIHSSPISAFREDEVNQRQRTEQSTNLIETLSQSCNKNARDDFTYATNFAVKFISSKKKKILDDNKQLIERKQ